MAMTIRMLLSIWHDVYQSYVPCFVTEVRLKHETHQMYCPSQADAHVQAWRCLKLPHERQTTLKLLTDTTGIVQPLIPTRRKIQLTQQAAAQHHLMACSAAVCSFKISSASCIASAFCQWDSYGPGATTIKVGFARKHPGHATGWTILAIRYGWGRCGSFMAILDLHHIGSKKIQKKQSQYASEFESLITFSFSSLICQHLPIHPSPKTHRLPTTANILWRCRTIVTSCLAEVVLTNVPQLMGSSNQWIHHWEEVKNVLW